MEMRIGYKLAMVVGVMVWFVFGSLLLLQGGCSSLDLDGNGKFDPVAYLQTADISVGFVDEAGNTYTMAIDELGAKLVGQFVQAKTGYLFELTDKGGITITAPDGTKLLVARKE